MNQKLVVLKRRGDRQQVGWLVIGILGWVSVVFGCVPSKVQTQTAPQFNPLSIASIAVVPFQALQSPQWGYGQAREGVRDPEEIRTQFRLPGADQPTRGDSQKDRYSVSDTAVQFITTRVESILRGRPDLRVIGAEEVGSSAFTGGEGSDTAFQAVAKEVGARLNVDGVVMGLVRTYRERDGSRMGAKPAAVGFEVFLVQPTDGKILWKGEFLKSKNHSPKILSGSLKRAEAL